MKKVLFAVIAMLFAACTTDTTKDIAIEAPEILTASFEEDTRIQLMNGKTVWNTGDLVSVFYKSDANDCYKFTGTTGDRTSTLQRVTKGEESRRGDNVVVVYPYNKNYLISLSAGTVEAHLPAEQTYVNESFGIGSSPMVGVSDYKQFVLKNVCGWLKVQFTGHGEVVDRITLRGNNGEQVAGDIMIVAEDASTILASAGVGLDDDLQVGGSLLDEDSIITEVSLVCPDGVTLGEEPTAFYIALPPQTFEGGFTVVAECADGSLMTKSTKNKVVIARNTIQPMDALEYKADVPKNQIWYTSSDGEVVTPYKTDVFGANIVSNTYENGQGVITFDGEVTSIGKSAFSHCSSLTSITIPDSVTSIGEFAFNDCSCLTSVTIPESVTSIGSNAFMYCFKLTSVTIPNSVTSIGSVAFYNCSSLISVTIPERVTSIGYSAFEFCSSLKDVYINAIYPPSLGDSVFSDTALENIYVYSECVNTYKSKWSNYASKIVSNNKSAGESVFTYTTTDGNAIDELKIEFVVKSNTYTDGVGKLVVYGEKAIPNKAFYQCNTLKTITIPDSVTSIGNYAFSYCSSLASVTIGNSVTSIGNYAFSGCSSLASVTIGNSVTSIGNYAFRSCSRLTSVIIPDSVTTLGYNPFRNCSNLAEFNGKFASADKRCLIVDGVLNSFAIGCGVTEYTIHDSVTSIGDYAFSHCSSLETVTIPNSVTSIESYAFSSCSSLQNIYCKPAIPPVADFGYYTSWDAFNSNASGRKIYVPRASESAYEAANGWSDYAADIEPYEF